MFYLRARLLLCWTWRRCLRRAALGPIQSGTAEGRCSGLSRAHPRSPECRSRCWTWGERSGSFCSVLPLSNLTLIVEEKQFLQCFFKWLLTEEVRRKSLEVIKCFSFDYIHLFIQVTTLYFLYCIITKYFFPFSWIIINNWFWKLWNCSVW